jgi:hypothetical protein
MQIGAEGRLGRNPVAGGCRRDRNGIGVRARPRLHKPVERCTGPNGARHLEEGAALGDRLEVAFLRRRERGGKLGHGTQRFVIECRCGAMCVRE